MSTLEGKCEWHFAPQTGRNSGMNDAVEEKFDEHPYTSLIRESIQNSLDAAIRGAENKPMKINMEISFGFIWKKDYPKFFELKDHIEGCIERYGRKPAAVNKYQPMVDILNNDSTGFSTINYIKISDFNTTGMAYTDDIKNNVNTGWYGFVQSVGDNIKSDSGSGGSFGFGKGAYFLISPIRTIMVSTMTEDGKCYFTGISQLCTHLYGNELMSDTGFYGKDCDGNPLCDDEIPQDLRRKKYGTDIYILGIDNSKQGEIIEEMRESVLRNFWLSIYNDKIDVIIDNNPITKSNIEDYMKSLEDEDHTKKMDFPQCCNPNPYFNAFKLAGTDNKHRLFEGEGQHIGKMRFYVMPSKENISRRIYMRSPYMMVQGIHESNSYGYYGVFVCDDETEGKGNRLLRKTENSSHTKWSEKNKVKYARKTNIGYALDEIEDFIGKCLDDMFSVSDKKTLEIVDLDKYLRIPTEEENEEKEEQDGKPNEGGQNIATANDDPEARERKKQRKPREPKIVVTQHTTATRNSSGTLFSGYKGHKRKHVNEVELHEGDLQQANMEDENGSLGNYAQELILKASKTFALRNEQGRVWHTLVLNSESDVKNVRVVFKSAMSDGRDETIEPVETERGECGELVKVIRDNAGKPKMDKDNNVMADHIPCIRKVELHKGVNRFRVCFADNMKHAITITTEEESNENE